MNQISELLTVAEARNKTNCRLRFGDNDQLEAIAVLKMADELKRLRREVYCPWLEPGPVLESMTKAQLRDEAEQLRWIDHMGGRL